jgi:uncharacterized protein YjlB
MNVTKDPVEPEQVTINPTIHAPNSKLPAIIYRSIFKNPIEHDNVLNFIHSNDWLKGGQWKTYKIPHFHSNTHECYVVIRGTCEYRLGGSPFDEDGKIISVKAGDVFVLPVSGSA